MKKLLLLILLLLFCNARAQVYTMQNGTFPTCSGTFYDSGGAAGDYGSSENYQITFCPATPGTYIQLNFTDFDLEGQPFDYMNIYNGTGTAGTLIGSYGNTSPMCATVIASTHPSGCITVTFVSDGSLEYGGWSAQIVCSNVPGGVPIGAGPSNAVCSGADPFCADSGPLEFPNSSDGGCVADAPAVITANTCLSTAPNPAWYYLEIGIPGNVNLEIEQTTGPNGTGTGLDVDYAIWGPFTNAADTCADFTLGGCVADHDCYGNVVDCSYSPDPIENATIPNAQIGQIYMVLITNFDGAPGFIRMTQTNSGSPGAGSTDCSIVCPTAAGTNPSTCGANDGSIRISGLDPNTNYTVTYLDDGAPVSVSVTSNASGQATISGLNAGNYTNIGTNYPGCTSVVSNVVLTAATAPVINSLTNNSPICPGSNAVFSLSGTANATVTYNINGGANQTVVLSAAGTATVTVNGAAAATTMNITAISLPGCTVTLSISSVASVNAVATITLNSAAATTNQALCINTAIANIGYSIGGGATGASATGLPAGVTGIFSGGNFIISGIPTASGPFNYTVTTSGGCSTASLTGTITVNQDATIILNSAAATTNQTLCINTAIVNISYAIGGGATGASVIGLPAGVTGIFSGGNFVISGTPTASGPFGYTVTTAGGCSTASLTGTITVDQDATIILNSAAATTNQTLCINTAIVNIGYSIGGGATGASVIGLPAGVTGIFSGGNFIISGIPTASGPFNYTVTTSGGCSTASLSGTITVDPDATITLNSAAATTNQTLCINTAIANIGYAIGGGATGASATGLPAGVTGIFSGGNFTISGMPTTSGPFNYTVTTAGGCSTASLTGTITVDPDATITLNSAAATTNQALCINTAIANISYAIGGGATGASATGLPAGVTGIFSGGNFVISGTPTASGPFNYTVTTSGGCSTASLTGTIMVNPDATITLNSAAATTNQTLCINTAIANISYSIGGGATGASAIGLPIGVTGIFSGGNFVISGTPTASGPFNYTVTTSGGCSTASLTGTITVNQDATITLNSAAATTNQTLCINTAIVNISYSIGGGATGASATGLPAGVTGIFSGGNFTISGTPTTSGPFNYTVTTSGGCSTASLTGTITVDPDATIILNSAAATTNQALCINTAIANISYAIGGGATGASATGLPAGVTGIFSGGNFTISGTPTASGPFNYTVTTSGGCSTTSLTGTITVNQDATITLNSAAATTNQALCINTAIANISYAIGGGATGASATGLPAGVTGIFSGGNFVISGTPTASGPFNYTVTTSGGCSTASLTGTITVNQDATIALNSAAATTNQTLCINTAIVNISYSIGGGATGASVIGLPAGVTGTYSAGQLIISGTPTQSGNFNYTITTSGGCGAATATGTMTVNPTAGIALDSGLEMQSVCINTPISNIAYAITDGGTGANIQGLPPGVTGIFNTGIFTISGTPTLAGTFNYTVTATGSNCLSPSLSGIIVVNPNVTIALTSVTTTTNQILCIDNPIVNISYSVANNATGAVVSGLPAGVSGIFNAGVVTISGVPMASGLFNYTVATSGGCSVAALSGTITVNPDTAIALASGNANQVLCINTPIVPIIYTIANGTGAAVTNLPSGVIAIYNAGTLTISGTPTASGEFDFSIATSGLCLQAGALGSITVNPDAVLTLNAAVALTNQVVCVNSAIQPIGYVVSSGASGAIVTGLPTGLIGNYASGIFTISGTPTQSGIFNYNVMTTGGCSSDTETGTITVNALATAAMQYAGNPYCTTLAGQPVSLSGTGPYTGGTFSSTTGLSINGATGAINPSLSTPGNYTVTYLIPASGGCPAIPIYATLTVTKVPTATISYATPFCTSVTTLQGVSLSGTAAYLGGSFSAPPGLSINAATGAINPSLSAPGNYTVTYLTPAAGGCSAVPATTNVTINATPMAVATPGSQAICSEDATNIGLSSLVAGTTFTWTVVQNNITGASNGSGNGIAQTLETTGNTSGTAVYTIVPSTAFCTGNPITVAITVNPLPRPSLVGGVICRNPNTGIVMRTYTLNAGLNNADYDFVWSHNTSTISATDNTYVADEPGIYTVVATNVHTGCVSDPVDAAVSESEIAEVAVISGNDAFVDDPVITVTVIGSGNYEYQLDNGNFQTSNVFVNVNIGEHTIRVRDQDDCTDIEQKFTLIGYPKFFTPNNDGFNDTWNIFALSDQKDSKISIFDRYGKLIKQISPASMGWDGSYNGRPLPATDYWFVVEYLDQSIRKEFKAHFSLKR